MANQSKRPNVLREKEPTLEGPLKGQSPSPVTSPLVTPRRGRHGRRKPLWIIALAAALSGVAVASLVVYLSHDPSPSSVVLDDEPVGRIAEGPPGDWAAWGFTHTQESLDATPAALPAVRRQKTLQAQHIMGFGADNPQPQPGRYEWSSLDRRMKAIRDTGGVPVITLCCAPDWMKGGPAGATDWSHLEDAPLPEFFDAFAEQAAAVAKRYRDVRYYFVWNEFKGFFNQRANRWDYEGYTRLYNKVYTALKKVDSGIQVGGPYVPLNSYADPQSQTSRDIRGPWGAADQRGLNAVEYWLKHKKGADFIVVDGSSLPEDRTAHTDEFAANAKFSALTRWLRAREDLPVVWAEWYVEPPNSGWSAERLHAVQAAAMIEFARSGAAGALYWSPQGSPGPCTGCLWDAEGEALPSLQLQQDFAHWFPPGTELMQMSATNEGGADVSESDVRVLASRERILVVNATERQNKVTVGDRAVDLQPYEIKWIDR